MIADRTGARLEDLPTVLDAAETMAVLRIGERRLYELVSEGRLRRLRYHGSRYLFAADEIRRFLADESAPLEVAV